MKVSLLALIAAALLSNAPARAGVVSMGSRVGEKSHFVVDTDGHRTSNMVKSGDMLDTVTDYIADPASYKISETCTFNVSVSGPQTASGMSMLGEYFTSAAFINDLRSGMLINDPNFKMKHMGYVDVTTMEGIKYPHSDIVHVYDITPEKVGFPGSVCLTSSLVAAGKALAADNVVPEAEAALRNIDLTIYINQEMAPIMGIVSVDISGNYSIFKVKVGADYSSQ